MSAHTTSYLDAVEHLPEDSILVLHDVSWAEYERLLKDLEMWPAMRVTYNKGRLEIMSPSAKHEKIKSFVHDLVTAFCDEMGISMENFGSTTFRRKRDDRGAEPDVCFYVANPERMIGKEEIDLDSDPPPDIVVEIDTMNDSTPKYDIYGGFGVPEIWRFDGRQMWMHRLEGGNYVEISASRPLSILTAAVLTDFIEQSRAIGRTAALGRFREWIRACQ